MKNFLEKYSLYLALALPVFILLITLAYSIIPQYVIKPTQDFLYAYNDVGDFSYVTVDLENSIKVKNGQVVQTSPEILRDTYQITDESLNAALEKIKFYRYDVEKDTNIEISFEEAQKLKLNSKADSEDGYKINFNSYSNTDFPLFFVYNSNTADYSYISKGSFVKKIELVKRQENTYYDYYNYKFLGWINE